MFKVQCGRVYQQHSLLNWGVDYIAYHGRPNSLILDDVVAISCCSAIYESTVLQFPLYFFIKVQHMIHHRIQLLFVFVNHTCTFHSTGRYPAYQHQLIKYNLIKPIFIFLWNFSYQSSLHFLRTSIPLCLNCFWSTHGRRTHSTTFHILLYRRTLSIMPVASINHRCVYTVTLFKLYFY